MPATARVFPLRRVLSPMEQERKDLQDELTRTKVRINQAYAGFNHVKDNDLIDSYVFEINSLQARYNYLLRRVKELEGAV